MADKDTKTAEVTALEEEILAETADGLADIFKDDLDSNENMEFVRALVGTEAGVDIATGTKYEPEEKEEEAAEEKPALAGLKTEAATEKVEREEEEEDDSAVAKLQRQIDELKAVKEASARQEADKDREIRARESVSQAMTAMVAESDKWKSDAEKKIAKVEEEYGSETAAVLREVLESGHKHQQKLIADLSEAKTAQARIQAEFEGRQEAEINTAIEATPDIKAWKMESEKPGGDKKFFEQACAFDNTLRSQEEWQNRPIQERFAAVARMTRAFFGITEEPGPSTDDAKQSKGKKSVTRRKVSGTDSAPGSLSEIDGGRSPDADAASILSKMDPNDIATRVLNGGIDLEQIEYGLSMH